MVHPLDGIEAKLARADFHFEALEKAIEPITKAEPDRIPGEFDSDSGDYVFRAKRDSLTADWLSPVIGDCIHNLRAALDYMVWAMSSWEYRAKHANSIEFPIYADVTDFQQFGRRKIGGTPKGAQTVIECLQPYNGPECRPDIRFEYPLDKPLWKLFQLENWDKHRALTLTEHVGRHRLILPDELGIVTNPWGRVIGGNFKRGTVIARLSGVSKPDVDMYMSTTYDIAFDVSGPTPVIAEPVLQTLDNLRKQVRNGVLPSLLKFLPRRR